MKEITLVLDEATADELQGLIYDVGEYFAAGAPLRRASPEGDSRIGRVYKELLHQLGKKTTAEAMQDWFDKVQSGLREPNEPERITAALSEYVRSMAEKRPDQAYRLLSPDAQRVLTIDALSLVISGQDYSCYEHFETLDLDRHYIEEASNSLRFYGSAWIRYRYDGSGVLLASMAKHNRRWLIETLDIYIKPGKAARRLRDMES